MRTDNQEFGSHAWRENHTVVAADGRAVHFVEPNELLPAQSISDGQYKSDAHPKGAVVSGDDVGLHDAVNPMGVADTIATIRELWRQRVDLHREEKSLTLRMKAICRRLCGGDKTEAGVLYKAAFGNGEHANATIAVGLCAPFIEARAAVERPRKLAESSLKKLASTLPVAEWWTDIRGIDLLGLAALVGEAGDLGNYANPAKLWKRMGLAVMPGGRQRRMKDKEAAEEHGYSPGRRSVMWNIGDALFKHQSARTDKETGKVLRAAGPYREVYDQYKARDTAEHPDFTKAHLHNRAKRYMEKRLLKHVWQAWRPTAAMEVSSPKDDVLPLADKVVV